MESSSGSGAGSSGSEKDLLLHLAFDEVGGTTLTDSSGHLPDTELNCLYTKAVYMDSQDPQQREDGIQGGSLLFDGNSTYVAYNKQDLAVEGSSLTVGLWAAPRTFEWDDPDAVDNGTERITGLVSQFSKSSKKGFVLGYERHGRLTFQIGAGEDWISLWGDKADGLTKCAWNQVAATLDGEAGTGEAIYYGVPMIAIPQMEEQAITARQIEKLGLGCAFLDKNAITSESLKAAIVKLLTDPSYKETAADFSQDMKRLGGAAASADALLRFLNH